MKVLPQQRGVIAKIAVALLTCALLSGTEADMRQRRAAFSTFPRLTIWAWERPERLTFLDPNKMAVAYLAETVYLGSTAVVRPRMQPLQVPPNTKLTAVVRLEARSRGALNASPEYRQRVAAEIAKAARLPQVRALQIDFDATASQRQFYAGLLRELRTQMPRGMPLSITALASWCVGDRWLRDLPIDEAVPMMFRLGRADQLAVMRAAENGIREPLCRGSIGLSTDEQWPDFRPGLRVYLFHPRSWDAATLNNFERQIHQ